MNDSKAILLFGSKQKNNKAFQKLFFTYHARLVLFANKFTGDLQISQDLVQDAFLKLWEKTKNETTIVSPKAYLFQAVKNSCLNHHRHVSVRHSFEEELTVKINSLEKSAYFENNDPLQSLLELEIEDKIEDIIKAMPEKCREVFKMSRKDFLKNKQIAKELDISEKMVEKHISKALMLLRSGISDYLSIFILIIFSRL
jgi:RNA polymerase sigma-70 factor (ECF subfamily)